MDSGRLHLLSFELFSVGRRGTASTSALCIVERRRVAARMAPHRPGRICPVLCRRYHGKSAEKLSSALPTTNLNESKMNLCYLHPHAKSFLPNRQRASRTSSLGHDIYSQCSFSQDRARAAAHWHWHRGLDPSAVACAAAPPAPPLMPAVELGSAPPLAAA